MAFVDETQGVSDLYHVITASDNASSPSPYQHPSPLLALPDHATTTTTIPVTDSTDAFFLWRYVDLIGPRFDMFDDAPRHFSTVVPQIALSDRLVLLACVAVAARQYFLVNGQQQQDHEQALTYYNAALNLLSKRLQDSRPDSAVFASCLLIAHCEMVESQATDWGLHLKGTGDILRMHRWHGLSGGLAQAVCYVPFLCDFHLPQLTWNFCPTVVLDLLQDDHSCFSLCWQAGGITSKRLAPWGLIS